MLEEPRELQTLLLKKQKIKYKRYFLMDLILTG